MATLNEGARAGRGQRHGRIFAGLGFWPPLFWVVVSITAEIGGSLLIILGLGGPIGPALLFGDLLVVTIVAHGPQGFWAAGGRVGVEFPIPLTTGALTIALLGHGGLSLDGVLGLAYPAALTPRAVIVALIGAGTLLVIRAIRGMPQSPGG